MPNRKSLSETVTLRVDLAERKRLEAIAAAEDRSLGYIARRLIIQGLAQSQPQQPAAEPATKIFLEV